MSVEETVTLSPGPRQVVDRVCHPQRGEGIVVYDNGPSFFRPDGGAAIPMRVSFGGWAEGRGSWRVLYDPVHGCVEAALLAAGEQHMRMWSPMLGLGWLVSDASREMRFEGDDGRVVRFEVSSIATGTPAYVRRSDRKKTLAIEPTEEEARWLTYGLCDGTVMAFRRDGSPAPSTEVPGQLALPLATATRRSP